MKARSSDEAGRRFLKLGTAKKSIRPPPERFPTGVQKVISCSPMRSALSWAKDHLSVGTKRITLEELRTVLGLDPVKDTDGNVIREARLGAWANFRQRALNIAMAEINAKTDLNRSSRWSK